MSESPLHAELVQRMASTLRLSHEDWLVFIDGADLTSLGCPPQLVGARPDLFARNRRSSHVLIGEAKTPFDIDNPHTELQIDTYFRFLQHERSGELHVAVPYLCAGQAIRICHQRKRQTGSLRVPFTVSGWMFNSRASHVDHWHG